MARKQSVKGFNFSRDMIADSKEVPAILRDYRSDAWQVYEDLPFPTLKDEAWRRTSLQGFDFGEIKLPNGKPLPEKIKGRILTDEIYQKMRLHF